MINKWEKKKKNQLVFCVFTASLCLRHHVNKWHFLNLISGFERGNSCFVAHHLHWISNDANILVSCEISQKMKQNKSKDKDKMWIAKWKILSFDEVENKKICVNYANIAIICCHFDWLRRFTLTNDLWLFYRENLVLTRFFFFSTKNTKIVCRPFSCSLKRNILMNRKLQNKYSKLKQKQQKELNKCFIADFSTVFFSQFFFLLLLVSPLQVKQWTRKMRNF